MSKNTHSAAPTQKELSGFLGKTMADFIATDGRSTIVELTIVETELGFELSRFESIDSNEPKQKNVLTSIASTLLEAAKHFVEIDHVGLEITQR